VTSGAFVERAAFVRSGSPSKPLALGLLDLIAAVSLGVTSAEGSPVRIFFTDPNTALMSSLPWVLVPAFLVPLLAWIHLALFYRLAAPARRPATAGA